VFDKTGTLTKGKLEITDIHIVDKYKNQFSREQMLEITTALEKNSEHPLGVAIYKYGVEQKVTIKDIKDFKAIEGKGITGVIDGQTYFMGNKKLMTG
jgi:Cu+-exporting ATPase